MYESQGLNGEAQVWQSYLKTKEFKEIQMDSKVIRQMADAVQNMGFHVYEFSLNLWEVYDLQEDEVFQYHGALRQLCKSLAPAMSRERAGLNQIEKFKKEELFHTPVFELSDLPEQEELLEFLQNSWIQYMYFYEAWNLTPEQQKKYGPGYLEIARSQRPKEERNADETFEPSEAAEDVRAIEAAYGLYLPLETSLYNKSIINYYMTIGNAYQYLKAKGVETEIYPDGSGFSIYSGGRRFPLGDDLRISLQTIYIWTK